MMKIPRRPSRRRAISGIIGAVILFTLLFTVGTEYFIFVNNANNLETRSLVNRGNAISSNLQENINVQTSLSPSNYIRFYFNNTGGRTVNVTSLLVVGSSGAVVECDGLGMPSSSSPTCNNPNTTPTLPIVANVGKGAPISATNPYIVTGTKYGTGGQTGVVTLKLITSTGNIFSATYPPTGVSLAAQALTSGAIGDLYLTFQSFTYYQVGSSGCTTGPGYSGLCLTSAKSAFSIVAPASNEYVAFSVQVTDLNNKTASIVLDQFTALYLLLVHGASGAVPIPWSIVSVQGSNLNIMSQYTPITLGYGTPTTIYFAAAACDQQTQPTGMNAYGNLGSACPVVSGLSQIQSIGPNGNIKISAGFDASVFIMAHGWLYLPMPSLSALSYTGTNPTNYGQNLPFVTSVFVQAGS